ncbi:gamma-glutamyl-gamma-aminobutyrate hydrolase family protein [candidate division KSB1 bacterium]|nr:gamma-glutamyl-gamma-aminobutyrate hydrolase family protein [candidate division KSB1 bacterium]
MFVYKAIIENEKLRIAIIFFIAAFCRTISLRAEIRPLIGITSVFAAESDTVGRVETNMSYVNAVLKVGGTPIVLPPIRSERAIADYIELLDGLVLVGGLDIPPSAYGEKAHPTVDSLSARRFWFESRLINAWLNECDKPILGICLGCQFINVMRGGSLIQDIPSEIGETVIHRREGGAGHEVTLNVDSRLFSIIGEETLYVNSYHHQAVDNIGTGLIVTATAPDGVIEALEFSVDRFGICVQWHPEQMSFDHRSKIFGALIRACESK